MRVFAIEGLTRRKTVADARTETASSTTSGLKSIASDAAEPSAVLITAYVTLTHCECFLLPSCHVCLASLPAVHLQERTA